MSFITDNKAITMEIAKSGILGILLMYMIYSTVDEIPKLAQRMDSMQNEHHEIFSEVKLSNHFLWAQCVNNAATNEERLRCIPPISKVDNKQELNMYSAPSLAND